MYYVAQDITLGMIKILEETNLQKRNELYYELIYQESCLHDLDDSHDKIFEKVFNLKINKNSRVIQDHNIRFDDYVTYFSKYLYFLKYYNGQPFDLKYKLNYEGTCRGDFFKRYKACGNNKAEDTRAMKEFRDSIGYNSSSIKYDTLIERFKALKDQKSSFKDLEKHIEYVLNGKKIKRKEQQFIWEKIDSCVQLIGQRNSHQLSKKSYKIFRLMNPDLIVLELLRALLLNTEEKRMTYKANLLKDESYFTNPYEVLDPRSPYCPFFIDGNNIFK
jgi:hypothetical protein